MGWATQSEVARLRAQYKSGMRIELIHMDDVQAPPTGTRGTIEGVDDAGSLMVRWETGSGLNVIPGVDEFKIITEENERR